MTTTMPPPTLNISTHTSNNTNITTTSDNFNYMVLSSGVKSFTITLYVLIFLLGILGNLGVVYVFGIKKKIKR